MKKIFVVILGILLIAAVAFALETSVAVAGPGGHHGGHHGFHFGKFHGFGGFGPGFITGGSSIVVNDDCPLVKRCYINSFGEKRCRWIRQCD